MAPASRTEALSDAIRACLPLAVGAFAAAGILVTVASLISTPAVDIGPFRSVGYDGLSLHLGHGLYHDPASPGYTGSLYNPLLPATVALLDNLGVWGGWPVLIGVIATAALAGLIGWLAVQAVGDRRWPTLAGGAGMAGLAVWMANSVDGLLYIGWTDTLVWPLAIGGLVAGSRAHRSRRAAAATVIALTLAFWAKQTGLAASIAFAVWLVILTARGLRAVRFTALMLGSLALVNVVIFGLLQVFTGGWERFFNVTLPIRQAHIYGWSYIGLDVRVIVLLPALFTLLLGLAAWSADRRWLTVDGTAGLLAVSVAIGLPLAMYFRTKQGGYYNQYLGVVWSLGALSAIAWGTARKHRTPAIAADLTIASALVGALIATVSGPNRYDLRLLWSTFRSVPAELRTVATHGSLFDPLYTNLVPGQVYTEAYNLADLLAADEQPTQLLQALLQRRFRYAVTYASALGPGMLAHFNVYGSAYGAYEANYFWKLDQVISAGYSPTTGLPPGVLERRPGPNRAAALGRCFGPFDLAGAQWKIRRGGGFWCRTGPDTVTLQAAPVPASELVTKAAVQPAGTLRLTAQQAGAKVVILVGDWRVLARHTATGWVVATRQPGRVRLQTTTRATLSLNLGQGNGLPVGPIPQAAHMSILAPQNAGVAVDTRALHLSAR